MSTLMRFYLASFSVIPKTFSVFVWAQLFSYRFHKDDACVFSFGSTFESRAFHIDAVTPKALIVLVWTEGLNASKWMRFQTQTHLCEQGPSVRCRLPQHQPLHFTVYLFSILLLTVCFYNVCVFKNVNFYMF